MSPGWLDDVHRFAVVLESTQQELLETLRLKRRALTSGSNEDLQSLNSSALDTARRLKLLSAWRGRLLDDARQFGYADATLSDVLAHSVTPEVEDLRARLQTVQQRFGEAQRENWIQWVISQRMGSCYTDVLDLLARRGEKSPVYGEMPGEGASSGGVMLDAAV